MKSYPVVILRAPPYLVYEGNNSSMRRENGKYLQHHWIHPLPDNGIPMETLSQTNLMQSGLQSTQ